LGIDGIVGKQLVDSLYHEKLQDASSYDLIEKPPPCCGNDNWLLLNRGLGTIIFKLGAFC
jgi:hypothetical protein